MSAGDYNGKELQAAVDKQETTYAALSEVLLLKVKIVSLGLYLLAA